mgnify:CR=1 FL=1
MNALSLLFTLACTGSDPQAPAPGTPAPEAAGTPARRPDIVLVTLDTTRADRLGAWGHSTAATDWLDNKASAGTRYSRAYSVQPLTIPSHATIMTGLWPWKHGVRSNGDATLDDSFETLAERLKGGGWQTAASVGAFVTSRTWGFNQGFDAFFDDIQSKSGDTWHQQRPADKVVDDAATWVMGARKEDPIFLWVHFYDAHFPYNPPEAYAEQFKGRPYDGEIAFMDDQLARLEGVLKAAGRDPIWAIIGDHGESLGEHRELTHGLFVYDATQHIPYLISGPGVPAQVVDQPVSQVDLVPTLLSLAERPAAENIDGKVQPGNPHPIWMESFQLTEQFGFSPHLAIVQDQHKLIHKPIPELYDLVADPGERSDLASSQAETLASLNSVYATLNPSLPTGRTQALDLEALARLQALGYITTDSFDVDFGSLPDPTLHRDLIGKLLRAEMHSLQREHEQALPLAREALAEGIDISGVHQRVTRVMAMAGQKDEARAVLEDSVRRFPTDVALLQRATATVGREGDNQRSLALAQQALAADPESERSAEYVVGALINLGRRDEALAMALDWAQRKPEATGLVALAGILLFEKGDLPGAEKQLRLAAKPSRPRQGVCERLGAMALTAGVPKDAERWLAREEELYGLSLRGMRVKVSALSRLGRHEEALALADGALTKAPGDLDLLQARAAALIDLGRLDEAVTELDKSLALHPEQADLLMLLANAQKKQGKDDLAQATRARAEAAHALRSAARKGAAGGKPAQ